MVIYHIYANICIIFLILILQKLNKKIKFDFRHKQLETKKDSIVFLKHDIQQIWTNFFEGQLVVYANSKTIPDDKEYRKYRKEFRKMVQVILGPVQYNVYIRDIFESENAFEFFINMEYEKHFKGVFGRELINAVLNDELNKNRKNN